MNDIYVISARRTRYNGRPCDETVFVGVDNCVYGSDPIWTIYENGAKMFHSKDDAVKFFTANREILFGDLYKHCLDMETVAVRRRIAVYDVVESLKANDNNTEDCCDGVDSDYFRRFSPIFDKYLPDTGEGETMAQQIVTAVNNLLHGWYNNGDVFDNTCGMSGGENDLSCYANWLYRFAKETQAILVQTLDGCTEKVYERVLAQIADLTLNEEYLWYYSKIIARTYIDGQMGSIYECVGFFECR